MLVDDQVKPENLSPYLRSVQVYRAKGNLVADLTAAIDASKRVKPWCWTCTALAVLAPIALAFPLTP